MTGGGPDDTAAPASADVGEGMVERLCAIICAVALTVMLLLIGTDVFTRAVLNFSYEVSDELAGYMLVAVAFLSLSVCHVNGSFHHVDFVHQRLSPRGRILLRLGLELLMLWVAAVLLWQYVRLELASWRFGEKAPTYLETPLWLPRLLLVAGMAALCWSLLRTILAALRELRAPRRPHGA
jgi:TRAP-type C4-dicarboxylate transport system permease small subunit